MKFLVFILALFLWGALVSCSCGDLELGRTRDGEAEWIEVSGTLVDGVAGLCGNGILDEGESCDDGNRMDCDGCSRNCEVEDQGCGPEDASTDGDMEEPTVPDPPQYQGDPVPVEQEPQEAVHDTGWFHIMWTGEYFSFIYRLACPEYDGADCLAMRRFDKNGAKIGPDWIYSPTQPGGDASLTTAVLFDVCWEHTTSTYGISWVEYELLNLFSEPRYNAYFQRLNSDGKPIGTPVLLWYDMIRSLFPVGETAPIRLGCKPDGYLVGYPLDVAWGEDWLTRYLHFEFLDIWGQTTGSAFYGEDHTDSVLWPESLRYLNGEFYLLHEFEPARALIERVPESFDITWRTALLSMDGPVFDWDVDEERGKMAVTMNTDTETFLAIVDESGEIDLETTILEDYPKVVSRITSIGDGKYAVAWQRCSCEGADPTKVEIVTESGLESEPVVVSPTPDFAYVYPHDMSLDITWTGEEIAVVIMLPDVAGTGWNQPYMQLLVP